MLSYSVTYFIDTNTPAYTIGVKCGAKLTTTKFKQFMKLHVSKEEKQLITVTQIEAISEEEIERRFSNNWVLIDR